MNLKRFFRSSKESQQRQYPRYVTRNSGPNRAARRKYDHDFRKLLAKGMTESEAREALIL